MPLGDDRLRALSLAVHLLGHVELIEHVPEGGDQVTERVGWDMGPREQAIAGTRPRRGVSPLGRALQVVEVPASEKHPVGHSATVVRDRGRAPLGRVGRCPREQLGLEPRPESAPPGAPQPREGAFTDPSGQPRGVGFAGLLGRLLGPCRLTLDNALR